MAAPTFENMDLACAKAGKAVSKKPSKELANLVRNSLAVLEEQGIYALFLFLKTRNISHASNVQNEICKFLQRTPQQAPLFSNNGDIFTSLQQMAKDLDKLLLARDLVRKTLVYSLYHARIQGNREVRK